MRHRRRSFLLALTLAGAACEGARRGPGGAAGRDSAGVVVMDNVDPVWRNAAGWRLADTPAADVGGILAPPQERIGDIVSVARTDLGVIALADASTQEVRLYSRTGRFIRSLGGRRGAPGFRGLVWVGAAGDSIAAYDIVSHELTIFGIPGARTVRFDAKGPFTVPLARFDDGMLLMAVQGGTFPFGGAPGELRSDSALLLRYGPDGAVRDTIGRFAWGQSFGVTLGTAGDMFVAPFPRPLAPRGSAAVTRRRIVVGSGIGYELAIHGADGRLQRLVRRPHQPQPVTPAIVAAHRAIEALPPAAESLASVPATAPAYDRVLTDPEGYLWVLDFAADPSAARHWSVFDPDGRWLGTVDTPAGFRLEAASRDEAVGLWRDADGAEHLRVYRILGRN